MSSGEDPTDKESLLLGTCNMLLKLGERGQEGSTTRVDIQDIYCILIKVL